MKLEANDSKKYGNEYHSATLEQWKTCVEMANSNTEKRNNSNNIFITLNVALLAVVTVAFDYKNIWLSIVGIIICIVWRASIISYTKLSTVKYDIVNEIERKLPLAPFTYEWEKLKELRYVGLTKHEEMLPWIFISLYIVSILVSLVSVALPFIKTLLYQYCTCQGG